MALYAHRLQLYHNATKPTRRQDANLTQQNISAILGPRRSSNQDRRQTIMAGKVGKTDTVTVLVGTTRGAFFFHSDTGRGNWEMTGPHLDGWEIYSLCGV